MNKSELSNAVARGIELCEQVLNSRDNAGLLAFLRSEHLPKGPLELGFKVERQTRIVSELATAFLAQAEMVSGQLYGRTLRDLRFGLQSLGRAIEAEGSTRLGRC